MKTKKIEDDFYRWNKEFLGLSECLRIKAYVSGKKQYPSMQEILCDILTDGDEERYVHEVVRWRHKDAFGRFFLTLPDSKSMEILHPTELFRLEGSCSHVKYYLLGQLDSSKVLDSIVTRKENIFKIHDQIREHYLKLTGISSTSKSFNHLTVVTISDKATISASQLDFLTHFCLVDLTKIGSPPRVIIRPV